MAREKLRQPHPLVPAELLLRILREFDVVGRVGIDEIARFEFQSLEVASRKVPSLERRPVGGEVGRVVDLAIAAEGHVELALAVEAAKAVIPGAIEIIEKRGRLRALAVAGRDQAIEAFAMAIEKPLLVAHRNSGLEPALEPSIKVNHVRIDVAERCPRRHQAQRNRHPAAKRLDQPSAANPLPQPSDVPPQPSLTPPPFEPPPRTRRL